MGTSGQISFGKRLAGQLFEGVFHADGRVEMLPMRAVPAAQLNEKSAVRFTARPKAAADVSALDGWLTPGGNAACNAWSLENRLALDDYAARIHRDGTAVEQLLRFLAPAEPPLCSRSVPRFDVYQDPNPRASHRLSLDNQSDMVRTATRWFLPLRLLTDTTPRMMKGSLL